MRLRGLLIAVILFGLALPDPGELHAAGKGKKPDSSKADEKSHWSVYTVNDVLVLSGMRILNDYHFSALLMAIKSLPKGEKGSLGRDLIDGFEVSYACSRPVHLAQLTCLNEGGKDPSRCDLSGTDRTVLSTCVETGIMPEGITAQVERQLAGVKKMVTDKDPSDDTYMKLVLMRELAAGKAKSIGGVINAIKKARGKVPPADVPKEFHEEYWSPRWEPVAESIKGALENAGYKVELFKKAEYKDDFPRMSVLKDGKTVKFDKLGRDTRSKIEKLLEPFGPPVRKRLLLQFFR
ncbi:hypothetical protein ACFL2T_05435 [Elusimicrobiota bacterium]